MAVTVCNISKVRVMSKVCNILHAFQSANLLVLEKKP